jgi:hypothetical protein
LQQIVEQLESCNYECQAGTLENNVAWQKLKRFALVMDRFMNSPDDEDEQDVEE